MPRKLKHVTTEFQLDLAELPRLDSGIVLWNEVFPFEAPMRIEVGVGNSPFLIEVAKQTPEFQYLGFEYSKRRVLKFLKRVREVGLEQIRMLNLDAMAVMGQIFASESVDHIYINHPDPWPKRRHEKKRLVRLENARIFQRLLRSGGGVSLRTDSPKYADQMRDVMDAMDQLENCSGAGNFGESPIEPYPTPFELKFKAEGKAIYYLEYRKPSL